METGQHAHGYGSSTRSFSAKLSTSLKSDPSSPESLQNYAKRLTFKRGPFDETGGWPSQLYVREARRMVSSYVVSQKDIAGETNPAHPVGLAAYGVDDWPYAVVVEDGKSCGTGR